MRIGIFRAAAFAAGLVLAGACGLYQEEGTGQALGPRLAPSAGKDTSLLWGDTILLKAVPPNDGAAYHAYLWIPPGGYPQDIHYDTVPVWAFEAEVPGTFTFTLLVHDGTGYGPPAQVKVTVEKPDIIVTHRRDWKAKDTTGTVFSDLAAGLAALGERGQMLIDSGTYAGSPRVSKSHIRIFARPGLRARLDGERKGAAMIFDSAKAVLVENLDFTNAGPTEPSGGILCRESDSLLFRGVRVIDNQFDGVRVEHCRWLRIENSLIIRNWSNGIRAFSSSIALVGDTVSMNSTVDPKRETAGISLEDPEGPSSLDAFGVKFGQGSETQLKIPGQDTIRIDSSSFDSTGPAIAVINQSKAILGIFRSDFRRLTGSAIFCGDSSHVTLSVESSRFSGNTTPIFCISADTVALTRVHMEGVRPDSVQKGIDLVKGGSASIRNSSVRGFRTGIIITATPVTLGEVTVAQAMTGILIRNPPGTVILEGGMAFDTVTVPWDPPDLGR